MNAKAFIALILALLLGTTAPLQAQGFAGLGGDATGFALPDPDYTLFAQVLNR